jgi:hypothetical protein
MPSDAVSDLTSLIDDVTFLRNLSSGDVPVESAPGRLINTYLAANRDAIHTILHRYYEKTTHGEREALCHQNVRIDPSTVHENFQGIALLVLDEATKFRILQRKINEDNLRMLLRGLHAVQEHGAVGGLTYPLLMSPVDAIWPAWSVAY